MFINADTCHHRPAAKRAVRQIQRLDITQRLSAAQIAFGNHCLSESGPVSALARQTTGYGDISADARNQNDVLNGHKLRFNWVRVFVTLYYYEVAFQPGPSAGYPLAAWPAKPTAHQQPLRFVTQGRGVVEQPFGDW